LCVIRSSAVRIATGYRLDGRGFRVSFIINNFSSLDILKILYIALIRPKLEHTSVSWNTFTSADYEKLRNIQKKFANVCYSRFDQLGFSRYFTLISECLKFGLLCSRHNFDCLFIFNVFKQRRDCHCIVDNVNLRVPTKFISVLSIFAIRSSVRSSFSAMCVSFFA
jgi:hypothetical protein